MSTNGDDAPIRVAMCDDQALVRTGIGMLLRHEPGFEFVGEAASGEEALALAATTPIDVLLMDIRMPGMDGITATRRLTERGDAPRILVLTTLDLDDAARRAVDAGAAGFILKATEPELLFAAIRAVAAGGRLFVGTGVADALGSAGVVEPADPDLRDHSSIGSAPATPAAYLTLSEREREVFLLAASGLSNGEIAARAVVSTGTVKTHISHILQKLELRDRVQLVVYAYEHGLVVTSST